jgi:predicted ATPase/DNA-binding SARP family transcriptional activator
MLRIHLLGQFHLSFDDQPLPFATLPKVLPLWACLLLERAGPFARESLAFKLWPDVPESEALANLRRHLHALRAALPSPPAGESWLLTEARRVQWNPQAAFWLDAAEFERLSAATDPPRLAEAVELYGGDLLPQCYEDWIIAERERLRELQATNLQRLAEVHRGRQDWAQAIHYARRSMALDELREDTARALVRLRYESGDRTGAMREYQAFEQRLREELGVPPMPETRALYETILKDQAGPTPADAPQRARQDPPGQVPAQLTSFVGREHELAAVQAQLTPASSTVRLLTLYGPGGSGKTRLAVEAATRLWRAAPPAFHDGVFFVSLAEIRDAALVAPALARALGLQERGQAVLEGLTNFLRPRQMLLVLDNFEQVREAETLVNDLLVAAPGLRVLVTSRTVLQLYGEHLFMVPPLSVPDVNALPPLAELAASPAVALFIERARAVTPSFGPTAENAAALAEICARLDGLPLAIELAAARSKLFGPQALLARLKQHGLDFLSQPAQSAGRAARQQTLRQAIDWSYHLLDPDEQRLFRCLGVFRGRFGLEAAAAVSVPLRLRRPIETLIGALVDHSLLRHELGAEPAAEPVFRMLMTLRDYAQEQLAAAGELEPSQERHAKHYLDLAEQAEPELEGSEQVAWLARLEQAADNLRAALEWATGAAGRLELAARLAAALGAFWAARGYFAEGRRWLGAVVKAPAFSALPALLRGRVWQANGGRAWRQGDYAEAQQSFTASLALEREAGNQAASARSLRGLGIVAFRQADYASARTLFEESLAIQRGLGQTLDTAYLLNNLGLVASRQGDYAAAQILFGESLALQRQLGNLHGVANVLNNLGIALYEQGQLDVAREHLEECLELQQARGDKQAIAQTYSNLGNVARAAGDIAAARDLFAGSLRLLREIGAQWSIAELLVGLGHLEHSLRKIPEAQAAFAESLRLYQRAGDRRGLALGLEGLGMAASAQGQPGRAARLWGAAETLRQATGASRPAAERAALEAALASAQAQSTPAEFEAAWEAGRGLALDQVVAEALTDDAADVARP